MVLLLVPNVPEVIVIQPLVLTTVQVQPVTVVKPTEPAAPP